MSRISKTYRYDHRTTKHRHAVAIIVSVCLVILVPIAFLIYRDVVKNGSASSKGTSKTVGQVIGDNSLHGYRVEEPFFSMQLPSDWKETSRRNQNGEQSITWQATKKYQDDRWLKVYIDSVPQELPVNRLLPVTVQGNSLSAGDISDNCATFTGGGTLDTSKAFLLKPTLAKWQGVDFICNLPNVVENQVGIGATGGVNQIVVTGETKGTHRYFFLYTDHNIQPNYTIPTDAMNTFRAK